MLRGAHPHRRLRARRRRPPVRRCAGQLLGRFRLEVNRQLELTALPNLPVELWLPELQAADVILVGGGNTGYLSYWFRESGLADVLPGLLHHTVYVGASAGSVIMTPELQVDRERLSSTGVFYDEDSDETA